MMPYIEEKDGWKKNSVPLCIDRCVNCPAQEILQDNGQWHYVNGGKDKLSDASASLLQYISLYADKPTQGKLYQAVKYHDLQLNVSITDNRVGRQVVNQPCKVQIMKPDYFNKIRTSTPKKTTQPLNLTYARFWLEVVKNSVYLCVSDTSAWKSYDDKSFRRCPMQSVIGAYVNKSMEVGLAMMSSFKDTQIAFEWCIRKEYLANLRLNDVTLSLCLTGNKERQDWQWDLPLNVNDVAPYYNTIFDKVANVSMDCRYGNTCVPQLLPPQAFPMQNKFYEENCQINDKVVDNFRFHSSTVAPYPITGTTFEVNDNWNYLSSVVDSKQIEIAQENNRNKRATKRKRPEMEMEMEMGMGMEIEMGLERGMGQSIMGLFNFDQSGGYLPSLYCDGIGCFEDIGYPNFQQHFTCEATAPWYQPMQQ